MINLPRVMIIAWRWGNSEIYRLPDGQTHVEWLLDHPSLTTDRFIQMDLHAEVAEEPLTKLVSYYLTAGNVLLFLHDNQDYGYTTVFRDDLLSSLARNGGKRAGRLYTRLFTGGQEPIYCTPHFPLGILGSSGTFGSDLTGLEQVMVVRSFEPENEKRVLNHEHFDAVWTYYWQHTQQSEKLGSLKEFFCRWARKYDGDLYENAGGYPIYLKRDPELWKALASFAQNQDALDRLTKNNEALHDFQDFSDFGQYIEVAFPSDSNGKKSEVARLYHALQKDTLHRIFYETIDDHEVLTEDLYNRMDSLYLALSGENF